MHRASKMAANTSTSTATFKTHFYGERYNQMKPHMRNSIKDPHRTRHASGQVRN